MKQIKYIIAILLLYAIWGCSKEEILQPDILVSIDIKGSHSASYEVGDKTYFGVRDSISHNIQAKPMDVIRIKVAKVKEPVTYTLSINGKEVERVVLQGNLFQYETTQQLSLNYLTKKGVL